LAASGTCVLAEHCRRVDHRAVNAGAEMRTKYPLLQHGFLSSVWSDGCRCGAHQRGALGGVLNTTRLIMTMREIARVIETNMVTFP
jgi:hypothetical protein